MGAAVTTAKDKVSSSNVNPTTDININDEPLRNMEEEEAAADDGLITSGSRSDDRIDPILNRFSPHHQQISELEEAADDGCFTSGSKSDNHIDPTWTLFSPHHQQFDDHIDPMLEEAADDGFITLASKSDDHIDTILKQFSPHHQQSELLVLLPAAAEKTDEEEAPAAVVGPAAPLNFSTHINMNDPSNESPSSCYLSQQQQQPQPQPEQLRKMEEEAADNGFITLGSKSDGHDPILNRFYPHYQQSELLALLHTAIAPLNLFTDRNIKESSSSLWMRMKKKVSEIWGWVKSGERRLKEEILEWWCYMKVKGPAFWDGKEGRFSKDILWAAAELLLDALTKSNKGAFLSTGKWVTCYFN